MNGSIQYCEVVHILTEILSYDVCHVGNYECAWRSRYGAAYECWFHGVETALLEVTSSPQTYLYLPNQKNSSLLLSGDKQIKASDPLYNVSGHFTQSFVADVP